MEPRHGRRGGRRLSGKRKATPVAARHRARRPAPPGSESRARARGRHRNLGAPVDAAEEAVRPNEGNEARSEVGGVSERCVVPKKPGNRAEGTRWREGGAELRNRTEDRWERHRARKPSQQNSSG